ncbi:MobF family relaxase [Nocardioides sp. Kera G14]|uniref:MobF family relaxase n=1 Tax=Nocardioides sp. Kera G14 TaxID=2884264 RepID=UPI001D12051D|nr:MobF family relaxase [Nocardioides sp. Kera G14]UDY22926.1 relaxase domain-containing protein [Nocardioides sp. Kera G14]
MKVYRGAAAAARHYVEADCSRADDYYLAEGSGLAMRFVARRDAEAAGVDIERRPDMDGEAYEAWVAGIDLENGRAKGRLRKDDQAVRFVEVTVNGPKTWSLAAALHDDIAAAYDTAQMAAAEEIIAWVASHSTTRIGPRGRQVQVPVEEIEAAVVRHFTSRAGDPHRHLHLQINARVWASTGSTNGGGWRGLHTVGVRDSLEAINGIGHAAVMTNPDFRAALAAHGYTLDPETGEVTQLAGYAPVFSARSRQIEGNIDRYEADWRRDHPDQEPGPAIRRSWDRHAWAEARPDKVAPVSGVDLRARWIEELIELGFRYRDPTRRPSPVRSTPIGALDRDALAQRAVDRIGAKHSAWNAADLRGEVEKLIAVSDVVTKGSVRRELAEDLTARAIATCVPLVNQPDMPEHVRALSSPDVLAVEYDLVDQIIRANARERITVVEGAAGAGKTRRLAATREQVEARGGRMIVVTPTRKAAQVAADEIGTKTSPVAKLLHDHGYRWDDEGHWDQTTPSPTAPPLDARTLLVVDEAGMLDQDSARALLALADASGAQVALVGDRHQLPAVGRGGVLDLAARFAPDRHIDMDGVRRFTDPAYAGLSLKMRTGAQPGELFDQLLARGEIAIHPSEVERDDALAAKASRGELVVADTREQVARLNHTAHRVRVITGEARDELVTANGEQLGIGDTIATRHNDAGLGVANRELWTIVDSSSAGLHVKGENGQRLLPPDYVREHVELAYATTAYGAQGSTVDTSHVVVGEHTGAASAYVGMTRGREHNTAHLVAADVDDARRQWVAVFARERADLGPTYAAGMATEAVDRYGPMRTPYIPARRPAPRRAWPRPAAPPPDPTYPRPPSSSPGIGL